MFQQVLDHLPDLLLLYWTLATGAAVFTLLPGTYAPAVRWVARKLSLFVVFEHQHQSQASPEQLSPFCKLYSASRTADRQCISQQREGSYAMGREMPI